VTSIPFFDNAYEGTPTWDIGRPQGAVVRLAEAGLIEGSVLDVGCGTGEHACYLASRGHEVVGVDLARAAIDRAIAKSAARRVAPTFLVHDALDLPSLGRVFDTVLDVGLLHTLQAEDRARYAAGVAAVLRPGGLAHVLCWSDRNPFGYGPERMTRAAIRSTFADGWDLESIDAAVLETRMAVGQVHAWLARARRR
jgi:SAM-dependent methyltransferase